MWNGFDDWVTLKVPFWVTREVAVRDGLDRTNKIRLVLPLTQLLLVFINVSLVHFAHLFNLIQIDHEAPLVRVVLLDALSTEHRSMVTAIEVLNALIMTLAQQRLNALLVLEIEHSQS